MMMTEMRMIDPWLYVYMVDSSSGGDIGSEQLEVDSDIMRRLLSAGGGAGCYARAYLLKGRLSMP